MDATPALDDPNDPHATRAPRATEPRRAARRAVLAGAGVAAGATLLPQAAEAAEAGSYAAARHGAAPLLGTQSRHLVGRFAYGVTPALARQVRNHGGARRWFGGDVIQHGREPSRQQGQ